MDLFETFAVYRPNLQAYHFYFKDDIYEMDFYDEATQNDIINDSIKVHKVSENNLLFIFSDDRRKTCTLKDYSQFIYDEARDPAPVPESLISLSPPPPEILPQIELYENEFDLEIPLGQIDPILTPMFSPSSPSIAVLLLSLGSFDLDNVNSLPSKQKNNHLPPVSKRVETIVIKDALEKGEICPITLSSLTKETACCVSPCYHVFDKDSIQKWVNENWSCPICKEDCCL
jgi:hypothetical protein